MKLEWSKPTAQAICESAFLGSKARALLQRDMDPRHFLNVLLVRGRHGDAVRFLAYGLPLRHAVWWGCLSVTRASAWSTPQQALLKKVARWAIEPIEACREQVESVMGSDPLDSPIGCLAFAVAVTGPRIAHAGMPRVQAEPHLAPKAINGAVMKAAGSSPRPDRLYREFAAMGLHVLEGRYGVISA